MSCFSENMDFFGQHKTGKYSQFIITLFDIVGLIRDAITQQFSQTIYNLSNDFVLTSWLIIPS